MSKQKANDVAKEIERVRDKALMAIETHLDNGTMPPSTLPATFGVLFDKHRLQTDQSTQNVAVITYAKPLQNWIQSTNPSPELIAQKVEAIADAQGLNEAQTRELRAAVLP